MKILRIASLGANFTGSLIGQPLRINTSGNNNNNSNNNNNLSSLLSLLLVSFLFIYS